MRAYINGCAQPPCQGRLGRMCCRCGLATLVIVPMLGTCYVFFLLFAAIRDF
jgi:hypothetical protein